MKHPGSVFEFKKQRNAELAAAYYDSIASCSQINLPQILEQLANTPSSRFWVSEERTAIVMSRIFKGDELLDMRPLRREMYFEIFNRVSAIMRDDPSCSLYQACLLAVNSPAPKFYMTPLSIRETLYKIRRHHRL